MKNDELKMKNEEILMTGSYNHSKLFCRFNQCCRLLSGQKAALGNIVVSLTCTSYLWGTLIALCDLRNS